LFYDKSYKSLCAQIAGAKQIPLKLELDNTILEKLIKYDFSVNPLKLKVIPQFKYYLLRFTNNTLFVCCEKLGIISPEGIGFGELNDLLQIGLSLRQLIKIN
jgi:hypothetical protein